MRYRMLGCLVVAAAVAAAPAWADKKDKTKMPEVVLKAESVFVTIVPDAEEPMTDPAANRKAVQEVEQALMKWGRFRLALTVNTADLVIAVQKGTGKAASPTISGGPVDDRPVIFDKTDSAIRIGGQRGQPPSGTQTPDPSSQDPRAHPGAQVGGADDTFRVYQGGGDYPLDGPALWSYIAKDGLKPPEVAAVEKFKKAIEEAEKAAQKNQKQPQQQPQQPPQQPQQEPEKKNP